MTSDQSETIHGPIPLTEGTAGTLTLQFPGVWSPSSMQRIKCSEPRRLKGKRYCLNENLATQGVVFSLLCALWACFLITTEAGSYE